MYTCYYFYFHEGMDRKSVNTVQSEYPDSFTKGFWINDDWEYTTGDDAKHFIPQSMILKITEGSQP